MRRSKEEIRKSLELAYDMADALLKAGAKTRGILQTLIEKTSETPLKCPESLHLSDIKDIQTTGRLEWIDGVMQKYYPDKKASKKQDDMAKTKPTTPQQLDIFEKTTDEKLSIICNAIISIEATLNLIWNNINNK